MTDTFSTFAAALEARLQRGATTYRVNLEGWQ